MNFCAEIQRDRGGIEKMKSRNLKAMLFGAAFAASLTFVGAQPQMPLFPALEVHAASYQDVELDSKYDFEKAFQKALDVARDSEDKNTIYRIKIPAGTYKAGSCFNVYSNTYIDMEGVTLIRTSGSSMFRFGRSEDVKKISDKTVKGNIVVTDKNGTDFTQSQLDKLVFTTSSGDLIKDGVLSAKIQLWKVEQNVKVNIGTYGDPAPGYCVSEVKVTPENISIAGDEETLAELNGELSLTDMISVEGVSESFTSDTINLADYLKENYKDKLKVKSGTASTLSVRVIMEKMGTKKIDIPLSAITIKGRPTDLDMVLTPADKITVEVAAVDGSLDNIDQNDVKAVLDLTSYQKEGRHEVPVQITLPNGYELTSEVKIVVNLTKKQKTSGSNTVISAAEE